MSASCRHTIDKLWQFRAAVRGSKQCRKLDNLEQSIPIHTDLCRTISIAPSFANRLVYPKRSGACARVRLRDPGYGAPIVPRFGDFPAIRPLARRPAGAVILLYC